MNFDDSNKYLKTGENYLVTSNEKILNKLPLKYSDIKIRERINNIPTTRYYGSKRRLLYWMYENLKDISFENVLDAFGGTTSVSLLFKAMGKQVTYNDALLCNTICATSLLSKKNPVKDKEFVELLNSINKCEGIISKYFSGIFYTDDENRWLDGAVSRIKELNEEKRNVFLYCLFQACLQKRPFNLFHRANLNLRLKLSQKRSFGNLSTWNTSFTALIQKAFLELNSSLYDSGKTHRVLESRDVCELRNGYDLVYLDPPYLCKTTNSDNYLKKYHFLEGIAKYDEWLDHIDFTSKCLSFKHDDKIQKWQDKSKFQTLLYELVDHHKNSVVVLSYISDSYPSIDSISQYFNQKFTQTIVLSKFVQKALSKNKSEEVLFIGLP
jgi:adenine-specific DNA-methyltransferase